MELERSIPWLQKLANFIYSVKDVLVHILSPHSFKTILILFSYLCVYHNNDGLKTLSNIIF